MWILIRLGLSDVFEAQCAISVMINSRFLFRLDFVYVVASTFNFCFICLLVFAVIMSWKYDNIKQHISLNLFSEREREIDCM